MIRESSGTDKDAVARRMLRVREGDVEKGIPIQPNTGRISFEDAADDLRTDYRVNGRRSLGTIERHIEKAFQAVLQGPASRQHHDGADPRIRRVKWT